MWIPPATFTAGYHPLKIRSQKAVSFFKILIMEAAINHSLSPDLQAE
jgi:hypothetical protein